MEGPGIAEELIPVSTADGIQLVVHRLGAPQAPAVLLLTGAFSNYTFWLGTRGIGFARFLAEKGFCTYTLDFRGHGLSQRKPRKTKWQFEDWAVHDIPKALALASSHGPAQVVTHSASGAAILAALTLAPELLERISSLTILATPYPHLASFRKALTLFALGLCYFLGRFPARALRFGPEDEDGGIMAQWLAWNLKGRWLSRSGVSILDSLPNLKMPVLVVAGSGDWLWAPPLLCLQLYETIPATRKAFWEVGPKNGCQNNPGHVALVVSPQCRERLWPQLTRWLQGLEG
ncbi:MAG: alpha/beta fold hydrolase [Thermoanaerobaculaceae bacterium]